MNTKILIDAVVQQTMVLIAQLATSGGLRAPLAHVAGQAFLELAKELESQGVPKKVTADMFGLGLRTYQRRTQRLSQSQTDRGRSLWEAVYEFIEQGSIVRRDDIFRRFRHDDEAALRGVLHDLTGSGLVFGSGSGRGVVYRLATAEELKVLREREDTAGLEAFVWSAVYREGPVTLERLCEVYRLDTGRVEAVVASLMQSGRVERIDGAEEPRYRTRQLVLDLENPAGWEASVLDHFSTVVRTVTRKLAFAQKATRADRQGGSTYHLDLWRGHPLEEEVLGELQRFRERMSALRGEIDRHNRSAPPEARRYRVDVYYGQTLTEEEEDELS